MVTELLLLLRCVNLVICGEHLNALESDKLELMENRGLRSMQNSVSLGLPHRGSVKPNRAGQRGKERPVRGDS